jgi:hypothetical protein
VTRTRAFRRWPLALALLAAGCGEFTGEPLFPQSERLSPCGGMETSVQALGLRAVPPAYCDAELLAFWYDQAASRLTLRDARAILNCCGEHHASLSYADGVFVMLETDDPEFGDARCACMCVFDFEVIAEGIPEEPIQLRVERVVSDWAEASGTVWEGELDLTQGDGFEVIDPQPEPTWCGHS